MFVKLVHERTAISATRSDRCVVLLESCDALVTELLHEISDSPRALGDVQRMLTSLERVRRRVDSLQLRVIAAAEAEQVPDRRGHASTGSWVTRHTRADSRVAAADALLAGALGNGQPSSAGGALELVPSDAGSPSSATAAASGAFPGRSATGTALDEGRINTDHAKIIVRTLGELPEWVTDEQRAQCERELVRMASTRTAVQLRRQARRILEVVVPPEQVTVVDAHEDNQLAAEEARAWDAASFWIRDNHDGTMTGQFTVPTLAGVTLRKLLDAMTAPRRQSAPAARAGDVALGDVISSGLPSAERADLDWKASQLDWQHRRGEAFADLLLHLPTDRLHDKAAATVMVTIRLDDLRGELTRAGCLDTGHRMSAGQVRRTACEASILPVVLDGDSVPVDLGRVKRCFTAGQRAALATRYDECAASGCDRPFAWSELHHLRPWSHGGGTDLANAIPLCGHHHRRLHDRSHPHDVTKDSDGRLVVHFSERSAP